MDSIEPNLKELDTLYAAFVNLSNLEVSNNYPEITSEAHNAIVQTIDSNSTISVSGYLYTEDKVQLTTEGIIESTKKTIRRIIKWIREKIRIIIKKIKLAYKYVKEGIFGKDDLEARFKDIPDVTSSDDHQPYEINTTLSKDEEKKIAQLAMGGVSGWLALLGTFSIPTMEYLPSADMTDLKWEEESLKKLIFRFDYFVDSLSDINSWVHDINKAMVRNLELLQNNPSAAFTTDISHPVVMGTRLYNKIKDQPIYTKDNLLLTYGVTGDKRQLQIDAFAIVLTLTEGYVRSGLIRRPIVYEKEPPYKYTKSIYENAFKEIDPFTTYTYLYSLAQLIIEYSAILVQRMRSNTYQLTIHSLLTAQKEFDNIIKGSAEKIAVFEETPKVPRELDNESIQRATKAIHLASRRVILANVTIGNGLLYNNIFDRALKNILDTLDNIADILFKEDD